MKRGCGCGKGAASHVLLTLMVTATVGVAAYGLRKDDEPFVYKHVAGRTQQMYPFDVGGAIKTMVEVMEMEKEGNSSKDKMLPVLKNMVDADNSTINLRMKTAPQSSKQTLIQLQDIILKFLAITGIEAVLPLDCGKHPKKAEDVLRGTDSLPWVAALGSYEDGRFHYQCTGVLITHYHILTDADCVSSPKINAAMMNVTVAPGPGAVLNFVVGRRVHPAIKGEEDLLSGNNIGILEFALPFKFNDYIQPICLAGQFEEPDPYENSEVTIVGFHIQDFPTGRRASLYKGYKSRSLGSALCFNSLRNEKENDPKIKTAVEDILTKKHLCVVRDFELVGKSVLLKVHEKTGRVRVVGLGGVASAAGTIPIAYTLVQPHRFWIELVLKKFQDNTRSQVPATLSPDAELLS